MLIDAQTIKEHLDTFSICVKGVLHIGAHDCEELPFYTNTLHVSKEKVFWIDALPHKVVESRSKGIPNVFQGVITNEDDKKVTFNVSNNVQSSSILEFGTHAQNHPWVHYTHSLELQTTTIDTFVERYKIPITELNFWNLDIQGAEFMALKGADRSLDYVDALYLEVNEEEVYKGCGLITDIDELLRNYGFKRVITYMTSAKWGDALYVKSK